MRGQRPGVGDELAGSDARGRLRRRRAGTRVRLEGRAWEEADAAPARASEPAWSPAPPEREVPAPVEPGAGATALRRLGDAAASHPMRLDPRSPGRELPEPEPESETQLEDELRLTENVMEASERRTEAALAEARASARLARARPDASRAAGHPAPALACAAAGTSCLSSAQCCSGLACAGGVAGFGTRGRCQPPR
jgi:hypothetical protein